MNKEKKSLSFWLYFIKLLAVLLLSGFLSAIIYLLVFLSWKNQGFLKQLPTAIRLFFNPQQTELFNDQDRINFLLLGMGGEEHIAPDLTDTIIFTSLNLKTADLVMLAIPRDIWFEDLECKVNAIYHYGQEKNPEDSLELTKTSIEKIIGQPIHYAAVIDFEGFKKAIDILGGLRVKVDQGFVDFKYPVPGKENDQCDGETGYSCRYQPLEFEAGWQIMDGEKALQFVRSRNAEGEEGTDFARSKRQQKILLAFKNKLLSPQILLSPGKLLQLKAVAQEHIRTDLPLDLKTLANLSGALFKFSLEKKPIRTLSLETGDEENPQFLINPPSSNYGQWVLIPRTGDWQEIHQYLQSKIEGEY